MLPQLRRLERKYAESLVVVGVHSAKFLAEKATAALRQAVLRYGVEHPVVNDRDFQVWRRYAVRAWPTLMFIDPEGRVIGKHEGEFPVEALDQVLAQLIERYDQAGVLRRGRLHFRPEQEPSGPLRFPGKVLVDERGGRLFVADSGHHRLVVAGLDGAVQAIYGDGEAGLRDGPADQARFNAPQGVALAPDGATLFVADTDNHALRRVDLASGQVATIAGTGEQARRLYHGLGKQIPLNSPWDLALGGDRLYVAMAGFHQIWAMDLASGVVGPFAGTGQENLIDGPLDRALFAQPSGLALADGTLYVADSETSAVRAIDLRAGQVRTLVGLGLFEFGDVDGEGDEARLQHPLGIAAGPDGLLYVADSYNHKIRRLDPRTRRLASWVGAGEPGLRDGALDAARLAEPGGVSVGAGRCFVADTNNHAIRAADLASGEVATLDLRGL